MTWRSGHADENEAVATVKRVLTSAGLTTDAVMAHTLAARIKSTMSSASTA
jgi:hypothetical protein